MHRAKLTCTRPELHHEYAIPHILGIGFPAMLLVAGWGLAKAFLAAPWVHLSIIPVLFE
jgi:hypothetical protein